MPPAAAPPPLAGASGEPTIAGGIEVKPVVEDVSLLRPPVPIVVQNWATSRPVQDESGGWVLADPSWTPMTDVLRNPTWSQAVVIGPRDGVIVTRDGDLRVWPSGKYSADQVAQGLKLEPGWRYVGVLDAKKEREKNLLRETPWPPYGTEVATIAMYSGMAFYGLMAGASVYPPLIVPATVAGAIPIANAGYQLGWVLTHGNVPPMPTERPSVAQVEGAQKLREKVPEDPLDLLARQAKREALGLGP